MRRKVICLIICAFTFTTIFILEVSENAQAQVNEEWVAIHNGLHGYDGASDIACGPSGNIYVSGYSFDEQSVGASDTVAYDQDGNELWSARFDYPGISASGACAITIDSSENIYVTGFGKWDSVYGDCLTIAYDSDGNELWFATYNGPANSTDTARALTADSYGNIYITGISTANITNANDQDYITIKYDSLGNEVWVARWGGAGNWSPEGATDIAVDFSGNVYVTGIGCHGGGHFDYTTIKYDQLGNELWVARYSGVEYGIEIGQALTVDSLGNVYVTGYYGTVAYDNFGNELWTRNGYQGNDITVDSSNNVFITGFKYVTGSYRDIFTVKYDSLGNELWVARYNGPGNYDDYAHAIALDSSGNVYVTGTSTGTSKDLTTIGYDQNGSELWIASYNGPADWWDIGEGIITDNSGNVYVTGYSYQTRNRCGYATIKYSGQGAPSILQPTVNIDPDTLNLKSKGRWITAYITLPEGYDVNDIDISTIIIEDSIPAEWGDIQGDVLMVKFDRSEVEDMLSPGTYNLKVAGELTDGTKFEGYSDEIRVIDPEK